jgi:lysophospholipase L1-like esterase
VLCYGDSNTWGFDPVTRERMGARERWPGILRELLGGRADVVEEALNGRTTVFDSPFSPHRNGLRHLPVALESHAPLDVVVIALGTNDVFQPGVEARHAARGAGVLAQTVQGSDAGPAGRAPAVLVVVPPPFTPGAWEQDGGRAVAQSERFSDTYGAMAAEAGLPLVDLRGTATPSELDGIHCDRSQQRPIAEAVAGALDALLR